jgi:hypothetical protein
MCSKGHLGKKIFYERAARQFDIGFLRTLLLYAVYVCKLLLKMQEFEKHYLFFKDHLGILHPLLLF